MSLTIRSFWGFLGAAAPPTFEVRRIPTGEPVLDPDWNGKDPWGLVTPIPAKGFSFEEFQKMYPPEA